MLIIARGREVTAKTARIKTEPSLYGKKNPRVTVDFFGQRKGKAGCCTLHAGKKEMVAVLRRLADYIEAKA